jgi:ABC-type siderophore export system fused ATPase/permease subunit
LTISLLVGPALLLGAFPVFRAYGTRLAVEALTAGRVTDFRRGALILAGVVLVSRLVGFFSVKTREGTIQEFAARQRETLVKSVLELPLLQYESLARGDLVSRVTGDIGQASYLFTYLLRLVRLAVESVTSCVYMLMLSGVWGLLWPGLLSLSQS